MIVENAARPCTSVVFKGDDLYGLLGEIQEYLVLSGLELETGMWDMITTTDNIGSNGCICIILVLYR